MPKPVDGELDAEAVHLTQRGLFVEPLNYPFNENQTPQNGHEYIHLVRKETAALCPEEANDEFHIFFPQNVDPNTGREHKMDLKEWKNHEASSFSQLAIQLKSKKGQLIKKFSKKYFPLVNNEKDCCFFCLGSDMYKKIFKDEVKYMGCNFPYLSIVLHLSQEEILTLLTYMSEWSAVVGMNHEICRWIYALLACLLKPVSEECEKFLEKFYDSCLQKRKLCEETEKKQLHLISAILNCYFCVKAYQIGAPLSRIRDLK